MKKLCLSLLAAFFLVVGGTSLFAGENGKQLPIPQEIIGEKISEYLSTNSFYPYITPGKQEMKLNDALEPIIENDQAAVVFLEGEFGEHENIIKGMFVARMDKTSKEVTVKLLYLTNGHLITPRLFYDILSGPQLSCLCPKAMELLQKENGNIYIENNESHNQIWTFFTPLESQDVNIHLQDDGKGGTYFSLSLPKD